MKLLYAIQVWQDAETGDYVGMLQSVVDGKGNNVRGNKLGPVLKTIMQRIRKRDVYNRKFPPPPPSPIIRPNGAGDKRLIVPVRN